MSHRQKHLGLPRRVVAWYLFFCLGAVCWLSAGLLETSHEVLHQRTASAAVDRLSKIAAAINVSYLREGYESFQEIAQKIRSEGRFDYCSILDPQQKIIADTRSDRIGKVAEVSLGDHFHTSGARGVEFLSDDQQRVTEFHWPLDANGKAIGTLHVALAEPALSAIILETADAAPSAIALPMLLIISGGILLGRITRAAATVEMQLRETASLPLDARPALEQVQPLDLATIGWNRVVEHLEDIQCNQQPKDWELRLHELATEDVGSDLQDAFQTLSDGIAVTDAEGRLRFANAAVKTLLDTEINGSEVAFEQLLLETVEQVSDRDAFAPTNRQRTAVTEVTRTHSGKERILRVARQPNSQTVSTGHVWSLRDVTQQKLAEHTRDRFLDAATHELRTPLANIKAYAEALASGESLEMETQKEFFNVINSEVTRLARFVDDLLSISSMEVGSISVEKHQVEMQRLFAEVLEKVRPLLAQKEQTLNVQLPEKLGEMKLDKDKIVAILVNLLGNAAKYTPHGGHVSLKVKRDDQCLTIAVEDTGVGIAENEVERVFEKFFRSGDPRVQEESGSGLGLSIAKEIARMHGGDVECESALNEGSTFIVTLPISAEACHALN